MLKKKMIKGLSLFSNIGISEALLHETEAEIVIANEIDKNRCKFYENILGAKLLKNVEIGDPVTWDSIDIEPKL